MVASPSVGGVSFTHPSLKHSSSYLSIHPSIIPLYIHPLNHPPIYPSTHPFSHGFVDPSVLPTVIYPSIYLLIYPFGSHGYKKNTHLLDQIPPTATHPPTTPILIFFLTHSPPTNGFTPLGYRVDLVAMVTRALITVAKGVVAAAVGTNPPMLTLIYVWWKKGGWVNEWGKKGGWMNEWGRKDGWMKK